MKHPVSLIALAVVLGVFACQNSKQPTDTKLQEPKKNYFPVIDFLKGEINYVDSTPLGILKYDMAGNKTDSVYIQAAAFDQLAREFLPAELDSAYFEQHFIESSFFDQTSKSITFTYSSRDSLAGLQRIDVLATHEAGSSSKVKSIYMEKTIEKKDTFIQKKLYWQPQRSFFVITIIHPQGQAPYSRQLKVVWNSD